MTGVWFRRRIGVFVPLAVFVALAVAGHGFRVPVADNRPAIERHAHGDSSSSDQDTELDGDATRRLERASPWMIPISDL